MSEPHESAGRRAPRQLLDFLFGFACVFAGLLVLGEALAPSYVRGYVVLGELLLPSERLPSGTLLTLLDGAPDGETWRVTLVATPLRGSPAVIPVDLRSLLFMPTAAFTALALATPCSSWRGNARVLALGLPPLQLLLLALLATPLLSFLGGTGPVAAFQLSRATHTLLQIIYRSLVAPPGMAFALPLLLWLAVMGALGGARGSENRRRGFDFRSLGRSA